MASGTTTVSTERLPTGRSCIAAGTSKNSDPDWDPPCARLTYRNCGMYVINTKRSMQLKYNLLSGHLIALVALHLNCVGAMCRRF